MAYFPPACPAIYAQVDGDAVPVPHFGGALTAEQVRAALPKAARCALPGWSAPAELQGSKP